MPRGSLVPGQRWSLAHKREGDPVQTQLDAAMRRIGELSMENELLRARIERPGPWGARKSKR